MASSHFSPTLNPFCAKWDEAFTNNFAKNDATVQGLERKLESKKLSLRYPFFFQRNVMLIELNKQLLQLGSIFEDEYERYEKFNSNVRNDYDSVFSSYKTLPLYGTALSGGLAATLTFLPYLKAMPTLKYAVCIVPPLIETLYNLANTSAQHRTKEFLNWAIAFREGQSRLEFEGKMLFEKNPLLLKRFRHFTLNRTSPYDIYEKTVLLIREEFPENDTGSMTSFL